MLAPLSVIFGKCGLKKSSKTLPARVFILADIVANEAENIPAMNNPGNPGIPLATSVT